MDLSKKCRSVGVRVHGELKGCIYDKQIKESNTVPRDPLDTVYF